MTEQVSEQPDDPAMRAAECLNRQLADARWTMDQLSLAAAVIRVEYAPLVAEVERLKRIAGGTHVLARDLNIAKRELDTLRGANARLEGEATKPISMVLCCPQCTARHIDEREFETKPHHTHACQACGFVWRPAIVPTVGVQFLPGFKNVRPLSDGIEELAEWIAPAPTIPPAAQPSEPERVRVGSPTNEPFPECPCCPDGCRDPHNYQGSEVCQKHRVPLCYRVHRDRALKKIEEAEQTAQRWNQMLKDAHATKDRTIAHLTAQLAAAPRFVVTPEMRARVIGEVANYPRSSDMPVKVADCILTILGATVSTPGAKPCDIPLGEPSALHSELSEAGELDEHIRQRHPERGAENGAEGR